MKTTVAATIKAMIAKIKPHGSKTLAKPVLGKCYVPVEESCFEPEHLHGGALFMRMFDPTTTKHPVRS